jgi:hypothetical protein
MTVPEEAKVAAVDAGRGLVTVARSGGAKVYFQPADGAALGRMTVGQKVWIDAAAGVVSVDGRTACCAIVAPPAAPKPAAAGRIR